MIVNFGHSSHSPERLTGNELAGDHEWTSLTPDQQNQALELFSSQKGITFSLTPDDQLRFGDISIYSAAAGEKMNLARRFNGARFSHLITRESIIGHTRVIYLEQVPKDREIRHLTQTLTTVLPEHLVEAIKSVKDWSPSTNLPPNP